MRAKRYFCKVSWNAHTTLFFFFLWKVGHKVSHYFWEMHTNDIGAIISSEKGLLADYYSCLSRIDRRFLFAYLFQTNFNFIIKLSDIYNLRRWKNLNLKHNNLQNHNQIRQCCINRYKLNFQGRPNVGVCSNNDSRLSIFGRFCGKCNLNKSCTF